MAEERVERKLAAIFAADVVEYSRLTGEDEAGTRARFNAHFHELIAPAVANRNGRIVKTTGDGLLAEFGSVVDAVQCAVEIQDGMAERNADEPDHRRMDFRIGINLGDVIIEGDDIHGDGVNVAARLEALAEPGEICVAGTVFDSVKNKLSTGFENLGDQRVKNIAEPIRAYRVIREGQKAAARRKAPTRWRVPAIAAAALVLIATAGVAWWRPWAPEVELASVERMAYPLPDKPSIAVLPFDDLSGDADQGSLGDGLTENIIASLSRVPQMFVIASSSVFTYRNKPVKVRQAAEELGVRHVLTGSVQRSGTTVRVTARLIDALTGQYLWSGRYDRELSDIFAFQDDITLNVVTALQIELTEGEVARMRQRGTKNLEAWLLFTQHLELALRFNKEDNLRARELAKKAIELDPDYAAAYVGLGFTHLFDFQAGWVADRAEAFKRSVELAKQALRLDSNYSRTYGLLGTIHLFIRRHDQAITFMEKAINLNPNDSLSMASLAMIQNYAGQPGEAIALLHKAMRLRPYYPDWYLGELGRAYFLSGQYDDAIASLTQRLRRNPNSGEAQILLIAAYGAADRLDAARGAVARFLEPRPRYTVSHYAVGEFYKDPDDLQRVLDGLRKAGLPE